MSEASKRYRACYRNGVFEPLEPVRLREGTEVEVAPVSAPSAEELAAWRAVRGAWADRVGEDFLAEMRRVRALGASRPVRPVR